LIDNRFRLSFNIFRVSSGVQGSYPNSLAIRAIFFNNAALDVAKQVAFLQPLQGRSHQIKQMLTPGQKQYLGRWFQTHAPEAWAAQPVTTTPPELIRPRAP
jgi:hypothetical protein